MNEDMAGREETLEEYVWHLPEHHGARREYNALFDPEREHRLRCEEIRQKAWYDGIYVSKVLAGHFGRATVWMLFLMGVSAGLWEENRLCLAAAAAAIACMFLCYVAQAVTSEKPEAVKAFAALRLGAVLVGLCSFAMLTLGVQ